MTFSHTVRRGETQGRQYSPASDIVTLEQFAACESAALGVLSRVDQGASQSPEELLHLGSTVDFMLWSLFGTHPETSAFWSDGVEIEAIERLPIGLRLSGTLWCANHREQWRVPLMAVLQLVPAGELARIAISVGDASLSGLKEHQGRKARQPATWRCEFIVDRPAADTVNVEALVGRLRSWLAANAEGRIVGADWQPLSPELAEELIRTQAQDGKPLALKPTWLDGGPALQLA